MTTFLRGHFTASSPGAHSYATGDHVMKEVCVQHPTSADNVALAAFAAAHRAAALLLLTVGPPAVLQSIDISWPQGSQHRTRSSGVRDRRTVMGTS